ncbi:MAG: hypothetical protein HPY76_02745 [Anaerolineae bacterium]|nr:hypothetical protein [Anaerolineae bacterium]
MTVLILSNIGARDVLLDGEEQRPARGAGEALFEGYPANKDRLTLPMLAGLVSYVRSRHREEAVRVILFGTDQPESTPTHFRETDTLYFARLAARMLANDPANEGITFEERLIEDINPALLDEAIPAYDRLVKPLAPGVSICYAHISGGMPACNMALLLQGVRHFGENLVCLYTPMKGEITPINASRQVSNAFREAAIIDRLQRHDFANALPLMRDLQCPPSLLHLAGYAARRLDFDFEAARAEMDLAYQCAEPNLRSFIQNNGLRHDLDLLLEQKASGGRLGALLWELYWNACICYENQRYADFLARVYRFQEAALRLLVEQIFSLSTDLGKDVRDVNQAAWETRISQNAALLASLEAAKMDDKPLNWKTIGRPTYKCMLSFAIKENGRDTNGTLLIAERERGKMNELFRSINQLDDLVELRHRTIVGHDFAGVSEGMLLAAAPKRNDVTQLPTAHWRYIMGKLRDRLPNRPANSPYENISDFIVQSLRLREG